MAKIYRYQAKGTDPKVFLHKGRETEDFDEAIMATLTYATWVAWFKEHGESDDWQPVLMEAEQDDDWKTSDWTPVPTDDARVLAYFDQPDVDEIERSIVGRLRGMPYWLPEETATEALTQVEQYDGYRVQTVAVAS